MTPSLLTETSTILILSSHPRACSASRTSSMVSKSDSKDERHENRTKLPLTMAKTTKTTKTTKKPKPKPKVQPRSVDTGSALNWGTSKKHLEHARIKLPVPENTPVSSVHEAIARDYPSRPYPADMLSVLYRYKAVLGLWCRVCDSEPEPVSVPREQQQQQQPEQHQQQAPQHQWQQDLKSLNDLMDTMSKVFEVATVRLIQDKDYSKPGTASRLAGQLSIQKAGFAQCDIFLITYETSEKSARLAFKQGSFEAEISLREVALHNAPWLAQRLFGISDLQYACFAQVFCALLWTSLLAAAGHNGAISRDSLLKELHSWGL